MTTEGIDSSEILRPKNLSEAANDIFGPVKETHHLLTDELVTAKMAKILMDGVRILAETRGFNLDSLTDEEQKSQFVLFLSSLSRLIKPIPPPPSELPAPPTESATEIEINPNPIELTLNYADSQKEPQTIPLKERQKIMLAYFAALTRAKIERYEIPWITRNELSQISKFTIEQVYEPFLKRLRKIGLLEVSGHSGFRLNCDPTEVLKILQEENSSPNLNIPGFDNWIKEKEAPILIENYQLPFLKALYTYCQQFPKASTYLEISYLEQATGLCRNRVYDNLRKLKKLGIISSVNKSYTVTDVNLDLLTKIIEAQQQLIKISIKTESIAPPVEKPPPPSLQLIEERTQKPLRFPKIAWEETAEVAEINFTPDTILPQIDQILSAPLSKVEIGQGDNKYAGFFPDEAGLERPTILAILDYLGLGPEELKAIMENAKENWGLGTAIVDFEKKTQQTRSEADQLLILEIKSRLATLIMGEIISVKEVKNFTFPEILKLMEEKLTKPPSVQVEEAVAEELVPEPTALKPVINEKLLNVMEKAFNKEISLASNQPSIPDPETYLDPIKAYNFHRGLSRKTSKIPQTSLIAFGLAKPEDHPSMNLAGMLVAALYLNEKVHNKVMAINKGEEKSLTMLAIHTAHLLTAKEKEVRQQLEQGKQPQVSYEYIQNCLACLDKANIKCQCEKCLE